MTEEQIQEKIKDLQSDNSLFFKMTSDIIDIVYRKALEDNDDYINNTPKNNNLNLLQKENKELKTSNKQLQGQITNLQKQIANYKNIVENDSTNLKKIGISNPEKKAYIDILNFIEKNFDIEMVYTYVKDKAKEDINYKPTEELSRYKRYNGPESFTREWYL